MGYMKVIESSTTWTCPKTGSYKIICVAGGEGGGDLGATTGGESTSFGEYVTASGNWGGYLEKYTVSNFTGSFSGRNGYTFLEYGGINNAEIIGDSNNNSILYQSIGYGAGGGGPYPGGCGKLKIGIVTLNENDTVKCTIGAGGSGSTQSGKPGVIVIQYQGNDGWASTTTEAIKKVTINMYAYGELVKTITVNAGDEISLTKLDNVKSDDVEHYGWTKTAGSTSRNYSPTATVYPTTDMDLYAVFKYQVKDKPITKTARDKGTVIAEYDGYITISGHVSVSANGSTSSNQYSLYTDGNTPYVAINGNYISGILSVNDSITKSVNKDDVITFAVPNSSSDGMASISHVMNIIYPVLDYNYYYRSDV